MLAAQLPLPIETRWARSLDGTKIAYRRTPPPFPGAQAVVLANGLGGPWIAWRPLMEQLSGRYRLITWDYRGLYGSHRPEEDGAGAYAIAHHVRDLRAVLRAEGIERAALVGWSMGVQVVLEAYRRHPELPTSLVLLNGTCRRPLETLSPVPGAAWVVPRLVELGRRAHEVAGQVARKAVRQPEAVVWLKRMGLLGRSLEDGVFAELADALDGLDLEPFFHNLQALGEHDAADVLPAIRVPTLIIAGERDALTSPALAKEMSRRIPGAELCVVRGATHYTAVEHPELVSLRIQRFFRAHAL